MASLFSAFSLLNSNPFARSGYSLEFIKFTQEISTASTRKEQDDFIASEICKIKLALGGKKRLSAKRKKEYLVKVIYMEMMGYSAAGDTYMLVVELIGSREIHDKRFGYVASSILLPRFTNGTWSISSSIQQDLTSNDSPNAVVSAALSVLHSLATKDLMGLLYDDVARILCDLYRPLDIRKTALVVMRKFWELNPNRVEQDQRVMSFVAFLLKEPISSVTLTSVNFLHGIIKKQPTKHLFLGSDLVDLLSRVPEVSSQQSSHLVCRLLATISCLAACSQSIAATFLSQLSRIIDMTLQLQHHSRSQLMLLWDCFSAFGAVNRSILSSEIRAPLLDVVERLLKSNKNDDRLLGLHGLRHVRPSFHDIIRGGFLLDPDPTIALAAVDVLVAASSKNTDLSSQDLSSAITSIMHLMQTHRHVHTRLYAALSSLLSKCSDPIDRIAPLLIILGFVNSSLNHAIARDITRTVLESNSHQVKNAVVEQVLVFLREFPKPEYGRLEVVCGILSVFCLVDGLETVASALMALMDNGDPGTLCLHIDTLTQIVGRLHTYPPQFDIFVRDLLRGTNDVRVQRKAMEWMAVVQDIVQASREASNTLPTLRTSPLTPMSNFSVDTNELMDSRVIKAATGQRSMADSQQTPHSPIPPFTLTGSETLGAARWSEPGANRLPKVFQRTAEREAGSDAGPKANMAVRNLPGCSNVQQEETSDDDVPSEFLGQG